MGSPKITKYLGAIRLQHYQRLYPAMGATNNSHQPGRVSCQAPGCPRAVAIRQRWTTAARSQREAVDSMMDMGGTLAASGHGPCEVWPFSTIIIKVERRRRLKLPRGSGETEVRFRFRAAEVHWSTGIWRSTAPASALSCRPQPPAHY